MLPFNENYSYLARKKYIIILFLLGKMTLNASLSEDTTAGRLILTHCTSLLLKGENSQNDIKKATNNQNGQKSVAYLSAIEDSGKSILYLRLSSSIVQDFGLKDGENFGVEVQFQLNRYFCFQFFDFFDFFFFFEKLNFKPFLQNFAKKFWFFYFSILNIFFSGYPCARCTWPSTSCQTWTWSTRTWPARCRSPGRPASTGQRTWIPGNDSTAKLIWDRSIFSSKFPIHDNVDSLVF